MDVDSSTLQLNRWLSEHNPQSDLAPAYPTRPARFFWGDQACYDAEASNLLGKIKTLHHNIFGDNDKNYFNSYKEKATDWINWLLSFECEKPTYEEILRKHQDQYYTLSYEPSKDTRIFPLWDLATQTAVIIANWQSERAHDQAFDLMNDPLMLALEELRDWLLKDLANSECKAAALGELDKRIYYLIKLSDLIPNLGKDKVYLHSIQKQLELANKIASRHIRNRKLPLLLSDAKTKASDAKHILELAAHYTTNQAADENYSSACMNAATKQCKQSPIKDAYRAANIAAATHQADQPALISMSESLKGLNSLITLKTIESTDGSYEAKAEINLNALKSIKFPLSFPNAVREKYIEMLAIMELLSQAEITLEKITQMTETLGPYLLAAEYIKQVSMLLTNHRKLLEKGRDLAKEIYETADGCFAQTLVKPDKDNKKFIDSFNQLRAHVLKDTIFTNLVDTTTKMASTSLKSVEDELIALESSYRNGQASAEVIRAMQETSARIRDINTVTGVLLNEQLTLDAESAECMKFPLSAKCLTTPALPSPEPIPVSALELAIKESGFNIPATSHISLNWEPDPQVDPTSNLPIYTLHVYYHHKKIGSANYLGNPSFCTSADLLHHNIINRSGFLAELPEPKLDGVTSICNHMIPTTIDRAVASASNAGKFGAARGLATVAGVAFEKAGCSRQLAYRTSQILYYSAYFTSKYLTHHEQQKIVGSEFSNMNAAWQAAIDTSQQFIFSVALNALDNAGKILEANNWSHTGYALHKLSAIARYGLFASMAMNNGIVEVASALAAGTAAEVVTEETGNYLLAGGLKL